MPLRDVSFSGAEQQTATLAADVTMVNTGTFYDGPSLTLDPGVWLVLWKAYVVVLVTTSQSYWWNGKLWDGGSNIYDEQENDGFGDTPANQSGFGINFSSHALVTLTARTTVKISIQPARGSSASKITRDVPSPGSTQTATRITAIKVA